MAAERVAGGPLGHVPERDALPVHLRQQRSIWAVAQADRPDGGGQPVSPLSRVHVPEAQALAPILRDAHGQRPSVRREGQGTVGGAPFGSQGLYVLAGRNIPEGQVRTNPPCQNV